MVRVPREFPSLLMVACAASRGPSAEVTRSGNATLSEEVVGRLCHFAAVGPFEPTLDAMAAHGVVQGYNGLAVVDDKNQVEVHAKAHGSGY